MPNPLENPSNLIDIIRTNYKDPKPTPPKGFSFLIIFLILISNPVKKHTISTLMKRRDIL
jgi:hypothetical protein